MHHPPWRALKPWRGKTKTNELRGKQRRYYEWDYTHHDLEVYNHRGEHLGTMNPDTGEMIKPAMPGRRIPI